MNPLKSRLWPILFFLFLARPLFAAETVRVRIFTLIPITRAEIQSTQGTCLTDNELSTGSVVRYSVEKGFASHVVEGSSGPVRVMVNNEAPRTYEGKIEVSKIGGNLVLINVVPLESYVEGVLEGEAENMSELDALMAMSIVIRGYTLVDEKRHRKEGYDFCDLTHCQLYQGLRPRPHFTGVSARTEGQVLTYHEKIIPSYYHECCGGRTERVDEIWNDKPRPYLVSISDKKKSGEGFYCSRAKHFRWRCRIRASELKKVLVKHDWMAPSDHLEDVQVKSVSDSGRVTRINFRLSHGRKRLSGSQFFRAVGQTLGWGKIRSTWFTVSSKDGKSYLFAGKGYGHGVGLCQSGAEGMARTGFDYREILSHYFPHTQLVKWGQT